MENTKYKGNYVGTTNTNAENQDMAFVNDTIEEAAKNNALENPGQLTKTEKANKENTQKDTD